MAFRRPPPVALAFVSAALFACGGGAVLAASHGLYATTGVLGLAGVWIGAVSSWPAASGRVAATPAPPTALEAAEGELRVLANLLDQAPAPMLTLHADGGLRAANRAARRLFATEDRLRDPPAPLVEALGEGAGGGRRLTVDLGGSERSRTYAMSVTDFVGPRGVRRLAVLLDIQPELQVAEAAALRELMGVLNHEIMNGLTPIASLAATAADLLADAGPPDGHGRAAQAREAVTTLARRSEGLGRFVAAYRALAHLPAPLRRPTSLCALLEETARLFRARWTPAGLTLELSCPAPDVMCALDDELVSRALTNLLANAAEATLAAGARPPVVGLAGCVEAGRIILSVWDNGPGVPAADRARIFEPFFTTKPSGAGIGLNLTRQIARCHGGDLQLREDGKAGANFEIHLG